MINGFLESEIQPKEICLKGIMFLASLVPINCQALSFCSLGLRAAISLELLSLPGSWPPYVLHGGYSEKCPSEHISWLLEFSCPQPIIFNPSGKGKNNSK